MIGRFDGYTIFYKPNYRRIHPFSFKKRLSTVHLDVEVILKINDVVAKNVRHLSLCLLALSTAVKR